MALAIARHGWRSLIHSQLRDLLLLGALQFANGILFVLGLSLAGSFVTAVCQLTIPLLTAAYAWATGLERASVRRFLAMSAIILGCALTAVGHAAHERQLSLLSQQQQQQQSAHSTTPPWTLDSMPGSAPAATTRASWPKLQAMVPPPPPVLSSLLEARAPRRRPQHHARRSRTTTATLLAERRSAAAKQSPPDPPSRPVGVGVGILLLLGQCAAFVGLVVVQRRALRAGPPDVANNLVAASYALGTAWTLAYCALDGSLWRLGSQCRATSDVVVILASAIVGAACYFELLGVASRHLPPTLVACSVALEPLVVSLMGGLFFSQATTPLELAGYACACWGVCAMAWWADEVGDGDGDGAFKDTHHSEARAIVAHSARVAPLVKAG